MAITEAQVRQMVANQMMEWMGAVRGSAIHKKINQVYNDYVNAHHKGYYNMKTSDAWCANTVASACIILGIQNYTDYEISCSRWLNLAKQRGTWEERDDILPSIGDFVLYNWADGANFASTDNIDAPNHIGVVASVSGSTFYVVEGNMTSASKVGERKMQQNGRYIRGFIRPNYRQIADAINSGTISYPQIQPDGGYNNGSLTTDQVKELQKHFGLTADGYWGPGSQKVGGAADEAWAKYKGTPQTCTPATQNKPLTTVPTNPLQNSITKISAQCPYSPPDRVLRRGMAGTDVKWLQWMLFKLGFGTAGQTLDQFIDGSFGPGTETCLKNFQSKNGLMVDGSCGPATQSKLRSL